MNEQATVNTDPTARIEAIDILRGIALFGVMAVNIVMEFRVSLFAQFIGEGASGGWLEQCVRWIVGVALESKAMCLFSFLFGVGMAIQYDSLMRRGRAQYWMLRRLLVLLLFGLVHLLLIWNGDILTEYAVAALLVLPLLRVRTGVLAALSGFFLLLFAALPMLPLPWDWPSTQAFADHVNAANALLPVATWREVLRFSFDELPWMAILHAHVIARTVGLMLLGVVLWRTGALRLAPARGNSYALVAVIGIAGGVGLTLMTRSGWLAGLGVAGRMLEPLAPVVLAGGYGAVILWAVGYTGARSALSHFAPIGRMAFSNYIGQSLVFGLIFFGYGLGQFGRLDVTEALSIGAAVFTAQMVLSAWWLRHYRLGPLEWLWRSMMFGQRQKMRLSDSRPIESLTG